VTSDAKRARAVLPAADDSGLKLAAWLSVLYLAATAAGLIIFRLPGAMISGNEMSFPRAVFTVINAATLTGFQQSLPVDNYGPSGQACMVGLTIIGTLYAMIVGGMGLIRVVGLPYTDRQIIRQSIGWYLVMALMGAALLVDRERGLLASAFQAASAVGNSGLRFGSLPGLLDWRTYLPIVPLIVLGGLGLPVLLDLRDRLFSRRPLSSHTRVVLALSAAIYLIGLAALAPWDEVTTDWRWMLAKGSAMSLDARSAGFALVPVAALARASQWVLIILMIIGAAPGGSAGGLKLTTVFELVRGVWQTLRGRMPSRLFGIAATWAGAYLAFLIATVLVLLALQPEMPGDRLLFISASALGTVGLSQDPITITGAGLIVLSATMLVGRLAPLAVLWWSAKAAPGSDIAIG
jgi:trk system potassium uptake protein TrkH